MTEQECRDAASWAAGAVLADPYYRFDRRRLSTRQDFIVAASTVPSPWAFWRGVAENSISLGMYGSWGAGSRKIPVVQLTAAPPWQFAFWESIYKMASAFDPECRCIHTGVKRGTARIMGWRAVEFCSILWGRGDEGMHILPRTESRVRAIREWHPRRGAADRERRMEVFMDTRHFAKLPPKRSSFEYLWLNIQTGHEIIKVKAKR